MKSFRDHPVVYKYYFLAIFLIFALGMGASGYLYYENHKKVIKHSKSNELLAVADLKVDEIAKWRKERLGDATVLSHSPIMACQINEWFKHPQNTGLKKDIETSLKAIQEYYSYQRITLVDAKGDVRMSVPGDTPDVIGPVSGELIKEAMRTKNPVFGDIYRSVLPGNPLLMTLVAPLIFRNGDGDTLPVGALLLRVDPSQFLFPLIQTWPSPSRTSESVLVRREGNDVLFLNELRHRKDTALSLRIPMSETRVPAVMAMLGKQGVFDGIDYRGVKVLAAVRPIPDSPWFIVAKTDLDEVLLATRQSALSTAIMVGLLIGSTGFLLAFLRRKLSEESLRQNMIWLDSQVKERTRELEISSARLAEAQQSAHLGSWDWDIINDKHSWSDEMFRIIGLSPGQSGLSYEEFLNYVHPEDREIVKRSVSEAFEKNNYSIDYRIVMPDGVEKFVHAEGVVHYDEAGRAVRMAGILQDMSERKKAEADRIMLESQLRQAQKMETIGTLAGGIAHDFNNILTPIFLNSTAALMDLPEASPARKYIQGTLNAANRAKALVQQILLFSRKGEYQLKILKFQDILLEALKLLRATIPSSIEIRKAIDPCGPILADPIQMHQVIMNLCTNAYQAMRKSGGTLEVALGEIEVDAKFPRGSLNLRPGRYIQFTVKDSGYGMDRATMNRIFDPFFTTKGAEGTGLGLSVVHGIVTAHGGDIYVESEPGKGSTFEIYLPLTTEEYAQTEEKGEEAAPTGKERILLVDDEAGIASMGKEMLERLGYIVTAKSGSLEAIEEFRKNAEGYDLVVTDYTMPRMNGIQLAGELMNIRPDIPVILTSGFSDEITSDAVKSAGIKRSITKPFTVGDLAKAIRDVMEKGRA